MNSFWDWKLFLLILAIGLISLLALFSLDRELFRNQLVYWAIGLLLLFIVSRFGNVVFQKISIPVYIISILALIILLVIGEPIRGSVRWLDLGLFRFQPSEFAKAASVLILANYYKERSAQRIKDLLISFTLILPFILLIVIQPDIGNTLAFFAIWLGISFVSGLKVKDFLIGLAFAVSLIFFTFGLLAPYQKQRIYNFVNPNLDPLGTGYSIIQSKIAVGSGQFLGRGLGQGSQSQLKFLPDDESDFIFASISEQLGFAGALLLIIIYLFTFFRIIFLARITDHFGNLIIMGILSYLLVQFFVNIGMNIGLVPVTGITLPFVSYGGSSLITILILIGIVFAFKRVSLEAYH